MALLPRGHDSRLGGLTRRTTSISSESADTWGHAGRGVGVRAALDSGRPITPRAPGRGLDAAGEFGTSPRWISVTPRCVTRPGAACVGPPGPPAPPRKSEIRSGVFISTIPIPIRSPKSSEGRMASSAGPEADRIASRVVRVGSGLRICFRPSDGEFRTLGRDVISSNAGTPFDGSLIFDTCAQIGSRSQPFEWSHDSPVAVDLSGARCFDHSRSADRFRSRDRVASVLRS